MYVCTEILPHLRTLSSAILSKKVDGNEGIGCQPVWREYRHTDFNFTICFIDCVTLIHKHHPGHCGDRQIWYEGTYSLLSSRWNVQSHCHLRTASPYECHVPAVAFACIGNQLLLVCMQGKGSTWHSFHWSCNPSVLFQLVIMGTWILPIALAEFVGQRLTASAKCREISLIRVGIIVGS